MKKMLICGLLSMVFISFIACDSKDKPAENLEDLKEKYAEKEFESCDEFFAATEEMMTVYIKAIENADVEDENANKELDEISAFISKFDKQSDKFKEECPEKYAEIVDKFSKKLEKYVEKISIIYGLNEVEEEFEMIDEELQEELEVITEGEQE